jgi:hypothetical protein
MIEKFSVCCLMLLVYVNSYAARGLLDEPTCVRPKSGLYKGACQARASTEFEQSPYYSLFNWIVCLQNKGHGSGGGMGSAIFFSELIPEWEKEIDAHLISLNKLLSKRHKKQLWKEQQVWEAARTRALEKKSREPLQQGTMYMVFRAFDVMEFPLRRALELGCRVEKLMNNK